MRKRISILLIVFLTISLFSMLSCSKETDETIKIGAILPLTGNLSFYGNEVKRGLLLYSEFEENNSIEYLFEDNNSKANISVTIFNKFGPDDKIPVIISCNSPMSIPLKPLAEKYKKVLLALVTGAVDFGEDNIWCFRDAIRQRPQTIALANYVINDLKLTKGATFVVNDDYGTDGAEVFSNQITELGGEILIRDTFTMDQRDMRNSIAKILSKDTEFILLIGREQTIISSIKQIREKDKDIVIIATNSFDSQTVYDGIKPIYQYIYFTSNVYDMSKGVGAKFKEKYYTLYEQEPSIYAIDAFTAGQYLGSIVSEFGANSDSIRIALQNMKFSSPLRGDLKVSPIRDILTPIGIYQIDSNYNKILIKEFNLDE